MHNRFCLSLFFVLALLRGAEADLTIYRDSYGVPSIQAQNLSDAAYGLGYAMAQDGAEQTARNFKLARGRISEVDGKALLMQDSLVRSLGFEEVAERKAQTLSGEPKFLLESFCAGANRALEENQDKLPTWIEPFTTTDVLALAQLVNAVFPLLDLAQKLMPGIGSNQFAVSATRSANGHAILSIDPHLDWSGTMNWYEFAWYTPDFNFRGVTFYGLPFGVMGHTDKVAWCMTNNNPSLCAIFTVKVNPDNPQQYSYHGEWRDFEDVKTEFRYIENGEMKTQTQNTRRTAWGPMLPLRSQAAYLSMIDSWEILDEPLKMARAKDAAEFRAALTPPGLSMWNILYADTKGNIGYQYNARLPKRDESVDWTKPVDGSDPKTKWGELWALDALPHSENPESGLLVNCNSTPWQTWLPEDAPKTAWPRYVSTYGPTTRSERLSSLLAADEKISVEEAMRYATDTQVPYASETVAALQRVAPPHSPLHGALQVLTEWDKRAEVGSRGTALFRYWLRGPANTQIDLARKAAIGTAWSDTERELALKALETASADLLRDHGRLDIPWGDVQRSARGTKNVPCAGFATGSIVAVTPNSGVMKDGKIVCNVGSSFRMIVEMDPAGVKSWSILPYGNSQDPQNAHYADQMEIFGKGGYKRTNFGLANAKSTAVSTLKLLRS